MASVWPGQVSIRRAFGQRHECTEGASRSLQGWAGRFSRRSELCAKGSRQGTGLECHPSRPLSLIPCVWPSHRPTNRTASRSFPSMCYLPCAYRQGLRFRSKKRGKKGNKRIRQLNKAEERCVSNRKRLALILWTCHAGEFEIASYPCLILISR